MLGSGGCVCTDALVGGLRICSGFCRILPEQSSDLRSIVGVFFFEAFEVPPIACFLFGRLGKYRVYDLRFLGLWWSAVVPVLAADVVEGSALSFRRLALCVGQDSRLGVARCAHWLCFWRHCKRGRTHFVKDGKCAVFPYSSSRETPPLGFSRALPVDQARGSGWDKCAYLAQF